MPQLRRIQCWWQWWSEEARTCRHRRKRPGDSSLNCCSVCWGWKHVPAHSWLLTPTSVFSLCHFCRPTDAEEDAGLSSGRLAHRSHKRNEETSRSTSVHLQTWFSGARAWRPPCPHVYTDNCGIVSPGLSPAMKSYDSKVNSLLWNLHQDHLITWSKQLLQHDHEWRTISNVFFRSYNSFHILNACDMPSTGLISSLILSLWKSLNYHNQRDDL